MEQNRSFKISSGKGVVREADPLSLDQTTVKANKFRKLNFGKMMLGLD